jgi:elongation factor Ts
MSITAAQVKELRSRTGSGMMECKKALVESNGDIEAAVESMRKKGMAKADKKAERIAAEGLVSMHLAESGLSGAMIEVNCETDFVSLNEDFQAFATGLSQQALGCNDEDLAAFMASNYAQESLSVDDKRRELIASIGENISVRRFIKVSAPSRIGHYQHGKSIGVLVAMEGGDDVLAKDIAMHIAASRPLCVDESDVPSDELEKERRIFIAQAEESGKPQHIIEKMVSGRVRKYLQEVTLLGQPFIKDSDVTVGKLLEKSGASVVSFVRYQVGEGIDKKVEDFAAEVQAQVANA